MCCVESKNNISYFIAMTLCFSYMSYICFKDWSINNINNPLNLQKYCNVRHRWNWISEPENDFRLRSIWAIVCEHIAVSYRISKNCLLRETEEHRNSKQFLLQHSTIICFIRQYNIYLVLYLVSKNSNNYIYIDII